MCDFLPRKRGQGHEGFQKSALTNGDNTFYLNDSSATHIGYTLNVCNRTDETINLALGVEVAEGIYSDGWYAVDSEKCRVFEETGKFEVAYINANTAENLQEWMGTTPLCVSWI